MTTREQSIKPSFNVIKKEIKRDIKEYRAKQWENKLKKIKILSDPKDWQNIKNILGMDKEKTEYPELRLNNKKATTIEEKVELFKQFLESIFTVESKHKISDQKRMLIETNILNDEILKQL